MGGGLRRDDLCAFSRLVSFAKVHEFFILIFNNEIQDTTLEYLVSEIEILVRGFRRPVHIGFENSPDLPQ
jgi:hypothetical protein